MKPSYIIGTVIIAVLCYSATPSQTEIKCSPSDQPCIVEGPETKKTGNITVSRSISDTKFKAFKELRQIEDVSASGAKEEFRSLTALTPAPTPKPDDQAAAPKPASNGSNPAELITRVELKYQYQNFNFGDLQGVLIVRGDYAFSKAVSFRADLPILYFNSKTTGLKSKGGIGDIVTSMTFVKMFSTKFVGAFVPRVDFPTATYSGLGSGKYAFKPLVAGVRPLRSGLALVGVLEYRVSFAGKVNRADIHEVSIKPILLKSFLSGSLKGFYANPKADIVIDFENNNRATLQAGLDMGKVLTKNMVVFWAPTVHVAGTKKESFKFEIGLRYLFR